MIQQLRHAVATRGALLLITNLVLLPGCVLAQSDACSNDSMVLTSECGGYCNTSGVCVVPNAGATCTACLADEDGNCVCVNTVEYIILNDMNITKVDASTTVDGYASLDLQHNKLSSFESFFPEVTYLELSNNELTECPPVLYDYTSVTTLGLSNNSLTSLEGSFPTVRSMWISGNNFSAIPPAVFTSPKLVDIILLPNPSKFSRKVTQDQVDAIVNRNLEWDLTDAAFYSLEETDCQTQLDYTTGVSLCISDENDTAMIPSATSSTVASTDGSGSANLPNNGAEQNDGNNSNSNTGVIAGGITGGVAVALLLAGVFVCWRRKRKAQLEKYTGDYVSVWHDPQLLPLYVKPENIQDVKKLGSGAFGEVWLVKLQDTQLLAAKRLRADQASHQQVRAFVDEIKLAARFDHPNIVKLVGASWTVESDIQALFEYMSRGDLRDFLASSEPVPAWDAQHLQIAADVAQALAYVHSFSPPVVHRDLKSRNVLLTSATQSSPARAKLTDFGVSRVKSQQNTMTQGVGTSRWQAPEVVVGHGDYGEAADVFSLGVVLSELDTHAVPYGGMRGPGGRPLPDVAILQLVATGEIRPAFGAECPPELRELAERCLSLDPQTRPTALGVATALQTMLELRDMRGEG